MKIGLTSELTIGKTLEKIICDYDITTNDEFNYIFTNETDYNYAVAYIYIGDTSYTLKDKDYVLEVGESETESYFRPKYLLNGIRGDVTYNLNVDGDISYTSDQIINNIYEPLRQKYPDYVSRENIGKDASGIYDMWCYIFGHEYYDRTVYIQGGVHSVEIEGYWAVARFCQLLCNNHSEYPDLQELYETTRFVVVPVVNVYGVSTHGAYNPSFDKGKNSNSWHSSTNSNGVNLNRDGNEESQQETINIHRNFDKYVDDTLVLAIDSHTTTMATWGDYLFVCEGSKKETGTMLRTNNYLLNKNVKDRATNNVFMGYSKDYPNGGITGSFIQYFVSKGIKSCTTEWSDYVFDYTLGTDIAITRATENLINQIIQNTIRYKFC